MWCDSRNDCLKKHSSSTLGKNTDLSLSLGPRMSQNTFCTDLSLSVPCLGPFLTPGQLTRRLAFFGLVKKWPLLLLPLKTERQDMPGHPISVTNAPDGKCSVFLRSNYTPRILQLPSSITYICVIAPQSPVTVPHAHLCHWYRSRNRCTKTLHREIFVGSNIKF